MGFVQRRLVKLVMGVVARPILTLAIAAIVLAASVGLSLVRLNVSTDQNKLFSSKVKFFRDWLEYCQKFPENDGIFIVIESKDPKHEPAVPRWTALAERITHRLEAMPKYVASADCRVPLNKLGSQGLLFEDPDKLKDTFDEAKQFVPLVKLWAEKPTPLTSLLGKTPSERFLSSLALAPVDDQTQQFVKLLADSWTASLDGAVQVPDLTAIDPGDPSRLGYYYVEDDSDKTRHVMLVRAFEKADETSLTGISEAVDAIRNAVRDEAKAFPEFTVGVTGRPALDADEMRITDIDTRHAEIVALSVVFVGLVIVLRSIWLAFAAELTLAVAIGWTFGFATITVGELNLLSVVFLIALIGIGMDYLIQILAAYRREAKRYVRPMAIWARVFRYVGPPIVTACMGASAAFLVSVFSDFRGAAELGIIAGGGLLLCLVAGYTVLPALLVIWPARLKADPAARYSDDRPLPKATHWRLAPPVIWIALLVAGIPFVRKTGFNANLLELQAPNLESVKLVKKLQTWSAVVLSPDLNVLRAAREKVLAAPEVKDTDSILDAFDNYTSLAERKDEIGKIEWAKPTPIQPSDLTLLANKAEYLAGRMGPEAAKSLREFAARIGKVPDQAKLAPKLSEWQEKFLDELREIMADLTPPPPDLSKVPAQLRDHLISADGTYALHITPREPDLWKQENLAAFVSAVEGRVAGTAGNPVVTGIASNIQHTTESIRRTFYFTAIYALAAIFLLVLIDLRKLSHTLLAISVLGLGLPMLVALMGLLHIDWNFANFFGLPILIGAGHEYGVFMMHRYKEVMHDPRRVWRWWDASDRALLLCAFVTSSSFGFFWALGHHEGLKSLGLVMALGSACIYLATIMVVRPILMWRIGHKGVYQGNGAGARATQGVGRG